jgi:hypothetical protein
MAFNALYNAAAVRGERKCIRITIRRYMEAADAETLLAQLLPPNLALPDPPPGNTEWDDAAPEFRADSQRLCADVRNEQLASLDRLAAMMALVYQVRCSLLHGNKNPQNARDNELVTWGARVLELVVPALETAMS